MSKSLVIVESPAKAKTINKILGKDYVVKASVGHVRDLPIKEFGVDIENGFKPDYVTSPKKIKVLKELKDEAKGCDRVYLAPDPDREGEAIAWHLKEALGKVVDPENFYRVTYNQITPAAIQEAFEHPTHINQSKVDAQQARRIIDRIVGYRISRLMWRRVRGGKSAGRVQTVALRLVVEREREILAFKPEKYWLLGAMARKQEDPKDPFEIKLLKIGDDKAEIKSQQRLDEINADLQDRTLQVVKISRQQKTNRPPPPFITSTLQQAASSTYGFTPKRTMGLAQRLYEGADDQGGLITYMRTDSVHLAPEALDACRNLIKRDFGDDYLPEKPKVYKSKSGAQEAHEAVRPTDVNLTPDKLRALFQSQGLSPNDLKERLDEAKLYELIWKRTVACQMAPAKIDQIAVDIDALSSREGAGSYLFRANASEVAFPGYMKVTRSGRERDDEVKLPPLVESEALDLVEWLSEEKETQPPPRFSEASLIKALEENGVGRPSTYAATISTLTDREYVVKEKRSLKPTEIGFKVHEYLIGKLSKLFDVGFTARMEEELDKIEEGDVVWTRMLEDFYRNFETWVEEAMGQTADRPYMQSLVDLLGAVKKWADPVKIGKTTHDDAKFAVDIAADIADAEKEISDVQLDILKKLLCKYRDQIPGFDEKLVEQYGLQEALAEELRPREPPRETTHTKLDLLKSVEFAEARKVGKKTYDDKKFCGSLREQVEGGKRLSERQVSTLDNLLDKYGDQIPEYERIRKELGLDEIEEDNESGPLLALLKDVTEWAPPVQRGKRTWSDQEFFESLSGQFDQKKRLSEKQRATLKKMIARYATFVPDYETAMDEWGLPPPKMPKAKVAKKKTAKKKTAKAKTKAKAKAKPSKSKAKAKAKPKEDAAEPEPPVEKEA